VYSVYYDDYLPIEICKLVTAENGVADYFPVDREKAIANFLQNNLKYPVILELAHCILIDDMIDEPAIIQDVEFEEVHEEPVLTVNGYDVRPNIHGNIRGGASFTGTGILDQITTVPYTPLTQEAFQAAIANLRTAGEIGPEPNDLPW